MLNVRYAPFIKITPLHSCCVGWAVALRQDRVCPQQGDIASSCYSTLRSSSGCPPRNQMVVCHYCATFNCCAAAAFTGVQAKKVVLPGSTAFERAQM
jgi:hypothetical protein